MLEEVVGENIRRIRQRRDFSQPELAAKIGFKEWRISEWERVINTPRFNNLQKLAVALNCEAWQFLVVDFNANVIQPCTKLDLRQVYARNVRKLMDSKGINQKQLATMADMTEARVSASLNNPADVTVGTVAKMAQALLVPAWKLLHPKAIDELLG